MNRNMTETSRRALFQGAAGAVAASALRGGGQSLGQGTPGQADAEGRRRADLEAFLRIFPAGRSPATGRINAYDKTWEEWVKRTGALPPDFASMPSVPDLPDPLVMRDGERLVPVTNAAMWEQQKRWMRGQVEEWLFGRMPPAPDNLRAIVTSTRREGTVTARDVRLEFGPDHRATLRLELKIPDGKGPFPVFLTNHNWKRPWLYTAVKRGYIGCYYAAADPNYGDGDDSDAYIDIYPGSDFGCLARWAWAASRAVDYLVTLPEVERDHIGLAGHSRGGKQALLAAAFDERIGAVIPSSGNTGEGDPWRYTTGVFINETIELLTAAQPHWFSPHLRFFAGREDKLPVDQNSLMAMVAPRGLMLYTGYAESASNPLGFERAYESAKAVYRMLGREENIWLTLREGEHPTNATDLEQFIDFLDAVFGRKRWPKVENKVTGFRFERWQEVSGERVDPAQYPKRTTGDFLNGTGGKPIRAPEEWEAKRRSILGNITSMLGDAPPMAPFRANRRLSEGSMANEGWLGILYNRPTGNRPQLMREGMGVAGIPFGDGLAGHLFYPAEADGQPRQEKWPVVVWLHPYTYQNGWSAASPWNSGGWVYTQDERPSFPLFVKAGFAVFAFDQIGFGARIHEARTFYERYPKWSLLGNMIADTRAAVDALANLEEVDASRIFLMGYALGAKVGLFTAGVERKVRGVISVCGVDALRLDTPAKGTEGIWHYSHLHGLLPRLGAFAGHEERLPFDYDEVLALVAPKPALVIAPTLDRYARAPDVKQTVDAARGAYTITGHPEALRFETPENINRFPRAMQQRAVEWLSGA